MSTIPTKVRAGVHKRSCGVCEGCGLRPAAEVHHRQYESRGGKHLLSNLIHLCGWGNHTGCHGVAHSKAGEERGWSVRSGFTPAEMPVDHAVHGRVLLDDAGGWSLYLS
jgi:5-methylcytosine-specific restriction endonuclease McrA